MDLTPFAKVFDAHGTQLHVTRVDAVAGAAYTVLGWRVEDLDAAVAALRSRGVEPLHYEAIKQDESGAWTAPGGQRITWLRRPVQQHAVAPAGALNAEAELRLRHGMQPAGVRGINLSH